jgi:hypothetical protein
VNGFPTWTQRLINPKPNPNPALGDESPFPPFPPLPLPPASPELKPELLELLLELEVELPVILLELLDVYDTSKVESEIKLTSVKTSLLVFSISMMVAELTPSEDCEVAATQFVNVTFPKSAKAMREEPSSKSSTIHSAFSPPRAEVEVKAFVTVWPVVRFRL